MGEKAVRKRIGEAVRKFGNNIKRNREDIGVVNVLNNSNILFTSEGYHGKIEKFFNIYIYFVVDKNLEMTDLLWSGVHFRLPFRLIPFRFCHRAKAEDHDLHDDQTPHTRAKVSLFSVTAHGQFAKEKNSEKIRPFRRR